MNNNTAILHHLVPQCLLKHFTNSNEFFLLDKKSLKISNITPKTSFAENYFNTIGDNPALENAYALLENEVAPIIDKIISLGSIDWLTYSNKYNLMAFFITQNQRTHIARQNQEKMLQVLIKKIMGVLQENKQLPEVPKELSGYCKRKNMSVLDMINIKNIKIDADFIKYNIAMVMKDLPQMTNIAMQGKVFYLIDNEKESWYIGDTPAVMHNEINMSPYGNIGFSVPFVKMYLPLSSRYALFIFNAGHCNLEIKDLSLMKADDANIECLNYLQIAWANRFIASKNNDFEFAHKILKERPYIKEGGQYKVDCS
jgi:hypothetical protein